jgi:hypothetical protein
VIVEADDAAADHLARREPRAPLDVVGRQRALGHPDLLVEPAIERQILGPAALERHGAVTVGVEEAGQERSAAAVDDVDDLAGHLVRRAVARCGRPGVPGVGDSSVPHHHQAIGHDGARGVERHDIDVANVQDGHGAAE